MTYTSVNTVTRKHCITDYNNCINNGKITYCNNFRLGWEKAIKLISTCVVFYCNTESD